jgi:N-acetylneuraminic acid mutarotase
MSDDPDQPRAPWPSAGHRAPPPPPPVCEPLEGRRLLASAVNIHINFQPLDAPAPPGYHVDFGRGYARRREGLTYGWDKGNEHEARDRDNPASPDQRYDTFNHLLDGGRWAIAVPNGRYTVRVVAGDADHFGDVFKIDVEGRRAVDGRPTDDTRWLDGTVTVDVTDGKLTIKGAAGSRNNKLSFVEIRGAADPAPAAVGGVPRRAAWTRTDSSPRGRVEAGAVQAGHTLYLMGGYNTDDQEVTRAVDVLDLGTGKWRRGADLPVGAAQTHAGVAFDNRRYIYWVAGQIGSPTDNRATREAWKYDTVRDKWSRFVSLPLVRYAPGLAFHDGKLYAFGGNTSDRHTATTDHWVLDTRAANPTWTGRAPMPRPSDHHGVAVVGRTIYSIGGEDDHGRSYRQHNKLFAYDPARDRWTTKADLPTPSSHFEGTVRVIDRRYILALGGRINGGAEESREVRVYDTARDRWHVLNPLPEARLGAAAALVGRRVYLTAGYSPEFGVADESYWASIRS